VRKAVYCRDLWLMSSGGFECRALVGVDAVLTRHSWKGPRSVVRYQLHRTPRLQIDASKVFVLDILFRTDGMRQRGREQESRGI
jgi:hypothetical protein